MPQQPVADAFTVMIGMHRYVFDQQVIFQWKDLDQRSQLAVMFIEIDNVLDNRALVVRRHRLGLTANQRNPFCVGQSRQSLHTPGVG